MGVEGGAPAWWTSTDGLTWEAGANLAPSGRALHVMAGPDGTVVAAGVITDADDVATPVVWTSQPGEPWVDTALDGLFPGTWFVPSAAWTPAGFVVTVSEFGQTGSTGHAFSSPDGITWTETYVDQDGSISAVGAAGTDALLISRGQVVRSPDGVTWNPTPTGAFDDWSVRDITTLADGRLLAAGDAYGDIGSSMATWIGTAEPLSAP